MKKILLAIFSMVAVFSLNAQNNSIESIIKTPPSPARLVNDYANVLTADQKAALETKLYQFDDTTSSQIVVVTVSSLGGMDVADAAIELGRSWGVGGKNNNNGVVLLISKDDRKLNISPGYGLEKALPDLICQQIIQSEIVPHFKGSDYYGGLDRGTDAIIQAVKGEYKAPEGYNKRSKKGISLSKIIFMVVILLVLLSLFGGGGGRGGSFMSRRGFGPVFFPIGGGGGGGWGGGGGGSSGGGGFGGFGGGSFGGGGSSGSW